MQGMDSQEYSVVTDTLEPIKEVNMKIAVWYDKKKPKTNLIWSSTHMVDIELEKLVLDVEEGENLVEKVKEHLGE